MNLCTLAGTDAHRQQATKYEALKATPFAVQELVRQIGGTPVVGHYRKPNTSRDA